MGTIEIIRKFVESNHAIERLVREALERLPLGLRYGISYGQTFRHWLAFLRESEQWSRERLETYQVEHLKDLLVHTAKNVPYYMKLFREYGFEPARVQNLDDIKDLPYLDKETVRTARSEFIAQNIPESKLITVKTSGTTGIPLCLYGTKETEEKHWATVVHLWSRTGYHPGARTVFFESTSRENSKEPFPWQKSGNRLIISSSHLVEPWIDRFIEMINRFRPEYAVGFPHTIAAFFSYVKNRKRTMCGSLKSIITVAEQIYPWQKELIETAAGARVFLDYGLVEKAIHGGGCEHADAYHFYPQYGLTEYAPLRNESHELVGTGFINYTMPLIRYRTGDICRGLRKGCGACGRPYDTAAAIDGRLCDFLVTADGRVVSAHLTIDREVLEHIERFQLYQEKAGEVELRVWTKDKDRGYADRLLREVRRCTSPLGRDIGYKIVAMGNENRKAQTKYSVVDQQLDMRSFLA
ncbi:MAG TPA: hypothetical protein VFG09_06770 [Thermodesulfovibrionales bacterium]|nr:hypothetical protein [Thermodesulfovibrionales bacterium]